MKLQAECSKYRSIKTVEQIQAEEGEILPINVDLQKSVFDEEYNESSNNPNNWNIKTFSTADKKFVVVIYAEQKTDGRHLFEYVNGGEEGTQYFSVVAKEEDRMVLVNKDSDVAFIYADHVEIAHGEELLTATILADSED